MYTQPTSITSWAAEDQPSEKMYLKGKQALTDSELLSILIGQVNGSNPLEIARQILASVDNNLHELGKLSASDLAKIKGLGKFKASAIVAALELGRRRQLSDLRERPRIGSSRDAYQCISALLYDLPHEEFWLLCLNKSNEVFHRERLSVGGMSGTVVDVKMCFKTLLDRRAAGFIAVHNHPSGNLQPSMADQDLTKRLRKAGDMLDLPMLDHLIVSERGYYSFADEGAL